MLQYGAVQLGRRLAWVAYNIFLDHVVPMVSSAVTSAGTRAIITKVAPPSRSLAVSALTRVSVDGAILSGRSQRAWAKYAIPKGLPTNSDRTLAIENPPHMVDDFSGEIGEGYGKGTKTLLLSDIVIAKVEGRSYPAKINYHVHEAERAGKHFDIVVEGIRPGTKQFEINIARSLYKGRYAFISTRGNSFIVTRMKDEGVLIPKPQYTLRPQDILSKIDPDENIVERKIDGSLGNAHIGKNRVTFRSHRETGETYYDRLPAVEFLKNQSPFLLSRLVYPGPSLVGSVFQGELVHSDGAARVSGILNSLPINAQIIQKLRGPVSYHVWNIVKYKGRDVSSKPYEERRALCKETLAEIRTVNPNWYLVEEKGAEETPLQFYSRVTRDPLPFGEGVVIKSKTESLPKWDKVKLTGISYWTLVEVIPGEGKYGKTMGKMLVENPTRPGVRGEIGSFAVPDGYRDFIWKYRTYLLGDVIKARVQDTTESGRPRAGVFLSFHTGEADLLMNADTQAGGDVDKAMEIVYKIKSSSGWKRGR